MVGEEMLKAAEVMYLPKLVGLDPVTVFWQDFGGGRGQVTITCYGEAWTHYWGDMGGDSLKYFFAFAHNSYLIGKLSTSVPIQVKYRRQQEVYLGRIVDAIKAVVKAELALQSIAKT